MARNMNTRGKFASVILLLVFVGSVLATQTVHAAPSPPLTLDGVGTAVGSGLAGQLPCWPWYTHQCSLLLTTTTGRDVIILVVNGCDSCNNISITDGSGLTFIQRVAYKGLGEYYARAATPLRADNITAIDTCDCLMEMQVFAVHGANTLAIFDQNPSIPATSSYSIDDCSTAGGICVASIQTSTIDFVIGTTAINDAGSCGRTGSPQGAVPGFTNIANENNRFEVDYAITTTPHSNVVFACGATDATTIVVDAISFHGAFGLG